MKRVEKCEPVNKDLVLEQANKEVCEEEVDWLAEQIVEEQVADDLDWIEDLIFEIHRHSHNSPLHPICTALIVHIIDDFLREYMISRGSVKEDDCDASLQQYLESTQRPR